MFSYLFEILLTESLPQRCCVTPLLIFCMHTNISKNNLHKYSIILSLKIKHRVRKRLSRPNNHWHLKTQWHFQDSMDRCGSKQLSLHRHPTGMAQDTWDIGTRLADMIEKYGRLRPNDQQLKSRYGALGIYQIACKHLWVNNRIKSGHLTTAYGQATCTRNLSPRVHQVVLKKARFGIYPVT